MIEACTAGGSQLREWWAAHQQHHTAPVSDQPDQAPTVAIQPATSVQCSDCGAPLDFELAPACEHCGRAMCGRCESSFHGACHHCRQAIGSICNPNTKGNQP